MLSSPVEVLPAVCSPVLCYHPRLSVGVFCRGVLSLSVLTVRITVCRCPTVILFGVTEEQRTTGGITYQVFGGGCRHHPVRRGEMSGSNRRAMGAKASESGRNSAMLLLHAARYTCCYSVRQDCSILPHMNLIGLQCCTSCCVPNCWVSTSCSATLSFSVQASP